MCRLIGFASPSPVTLAELVGGEQCAAFQELSRLHADGWGASWLNSTGTLEAHTTAEPGTDDDVLTSSLARRASRAQLVHLRLATPGLPVRPENSHPFVADAISFAHNGSITPTVRLRDGLSARALAGVAGDTDSELYLAAIRDGVRQGLSLTDAVHNTVAWLRDLYPLASLNALVMSGSEFVAVHASSGSATPTREFAALGWNEDLPAGHGDDYYRLSYRRDDNGAVVFSSTGIDLDGWTPLDEESITTVDLRSFAFSTRPLSSTSLAQAA
jgi:predicted glutamine amidotransferase